MVLIRVVPLVLLFGVIAGTPAPSASLRLEAQQTAKTGGQATPAAGSIRGRFDAGRRHPRLVGRPELTAPGRVRDNPDVRRSVVYLESAPRGAFDYREPKRAVMDQRNETFLPHVVAIMTGDTVEFPNSDNIFHNVFSLSRTRRFDLGRYAAGRSKSVRFDRPGIVRVFCDIHSHMNAFIIVLGHPFFDVTDADGRFQIDGVPPGVYDLVGWHEGETRATRTVTVAPGGITAVELTPR